MLANNSAMCINWSFSTFIERNIHFNNNGTCKASGRDRGYENIS